MWIRCRVGGIEPDNQVGDHLGAVDQQATPGCGPPYPRIRDQPTGDCGHPGSSRSAVSTVWCSPRGRRANSWPAGWPPCPAADLGNRHFPDTLSESTVPSQDGGTVAADGTYAGLWQANLGVGGVGTALLAMRMRPVSRHQSRNRAGRLGRVPWRAAARTPRT